MVFGTSNILDLKDLLINQIAGSFLIFFALSALAIAFFGVKFRMPNIIILMMIGLWTAILAIELNIALLLGFIAVGFGTFVGWMLIKLLRG